MSRGPSFTGTAGVPPARTVHRGQLVWATSGIASLNQAVALDPSYALAYEGMAFYYYSSVDLILPPNEAMPKAKAAAEKAISLDDTIAEAHSDLGMIYF